METRTIFVTGAGGTPAANFVRSIRCASEPFTLVGTDCDPFNLQRAETDVRYLVPVADDEAYIDILNLLTERHSAVLVHAQNDVEIGRLSACRDELTVRTCLPSKEAVRLCQDKYACHLRWREKGVRQPKTVLLADVADLHTSFAELGPPIWLRELRGAGGRGAFKAETVEMARAWIEFRRGWGRFTGAECLTPRSATWTSIWTGGELVVAQGRERLSWELGKVAPSGVSGVTGVGVTVSNPELDEVAQAAIYAVAPAPNGIFSVDCTYGSDGFLYPTEINVGRFFTTHHFFTAAGLNLPYLFVKAALGEPLPHLSRKLNPLREGLVWIRGVDFLPVLTTLEAIFEAEASLQTLRAEARPGLV